MNPSIRILLALSLVDFKRAWSQLVLADLLARVLAIAILGPLVGLILEVFLTRTATGVVTDAAILSFLLRPVGLVTLLVVGAVSVGIFFAEIGQLMVIGRGAIEGRFVTWLDALRYVYGRAMGLVQLGGHGLVRLLWIALPFLAALGAVYALLLRAYDINYYLAMKPPEFKLAALLGGLLVLGMALRILFRIGSWLPALPMVLFEGWSGKEALRRSEQLPAAHRRWLASCLVGWVAGVGALSACVSFFVGLLGDLLVPHASGNVSSILAGLGVVLGVSFLANLFVTVLTTALFPLFVLRVVLSTTGPGALALEMAARDASGDERAREIARKLALAAGVLVLGVGGVGGYFSLHGSDGEEQVEIIAHRGASAVAPENTMAAFERGIAEGADWLELDVQESAEGIVVVEHDRDFMRRGGVNLEVWKATSAEMEGMDVGSFFGPAFSDQRVPTLRQVLELAKGRAGVVIELKYYGRDVKLEERVVEVVEASGMESEIKIMSLEYAGVRKAAALRPEWPHGLLNTVAIGDLTRLDLSFLALNAQAASQSMVRHAHGRGMKVYAWTINDPVQMWAMMSRGVDGIITDRVALARQVQDLRAELSPVGRFIVWMAGEAGLLRGMEDSSDRDDA